MAAHHPTDVSMKVLCGLTRWQQRSWLNIARSITVLSGHPAVGIVTRNSRQQGVLDTNIYHEFLERCQVSKDLSHFVLKECFSANLIRKDPQGIRVFGQKIAEGIGNLAHARLFNALIQ